MNKDGNNLNEIRVAGIVLVCFIVVGVILHKSIGVKESAVVTKTHETSLTNLISKPIVMVDPIYDEGFRAGVFCGAKSLLYLSKRKGTNKSIDMLTLFNVSLQLKNEVFTNGVTPWNQ